MLCLNSICDCFYSVRALSSSISALSNSIRLIGLALIELEWVALDGIKMMLKNQSK